MVGGHVIRTLLDTNPNKPLAMQVAPHPASSPR